MAETDTGGAKAVPTAASLRIDRGARPSRRRGGAAWLLAAGVVVVAGGLAWSFLGRAGSLLGGVEVREGRAVRVSSDLAAERTTASGYVVARTRAAISPKYAGKLARLFVDVGDRVEAGQLLAELDHVELDASVARVEADLARAVSEVELRNHSVLLGTGQYSQAIPSGHCAQVSFDPVERTEGDDPNCQKAKVK